MYDMFFYNDAVAKASEGDIVTIKGKRYQITKKTSTAIAVRRWYWFDDLIKKLTEKEW